MTLPSLAEATSRHDEARQAHERAVANYERANEVMILAALTEMFPGCHTVVVFGDDEGAEFTPRCRISAVLDADGHTLYDFEDPTEEAEERIDDIDTEYVDRLIELSPDGWYGRQEISLTDVSP